MPSLQAESEARAEALASGEEGFCLQELQKSLLESFHYLMGLN